MQQILPTYSLCNLGNTSTLLLFSFNIHTETAGQYFLIHRWNIFQYMQKFHTNKPTKLSYCLLEIHNNLAYFLVFQLEIGPLRSEYTDAEVSWVCFLVHAK